MNTQRITFINNTELASELASFETVQVRVPTILKSWKSSLFSFEWLKPDGSLKTIDELAAPLRASRLRIEEKLKAGQPLEKPVLGIGILETVEIGLGRDVFLTLAAHGIADLPAHVPMTMLREFASYRV